MKMLLTALVLMLTFSIVFASSQDAFAQVKPKATTFTFTKVAVPDTILSGDSVTYTYTIFNSGTSILVSCTPITDPDFGPIATNVPPFLFPGGTKTYTVTTDIDVTTTNVASVTCSDIQGNQVTKTATETVTVVNPSISLVKTADPTTVVSGDDVTYEITLTNTGDTTVDCGTVDDDVLGDAVIPAQTLAPGEFDTFTTTIPVSATETNTASVTCTDQATGGTLTDSDSATVTVVNPSISLVKTADPTTVVSGDDVTYEITLTNTGDTTVDCGTVDDDVLGDAVIPAQTLAPGEFDTFTTTIPVSATETNTASVTCTDQALGGTLTDSDSATVTVLSPEVTIVKSVSDEEVPPDTLVTYFYEVENTGDVDLTNCQIVDSILGDIGAPFDLAQTESNIESESVVITEDVTNDATVTCDVPTTNPSTTSATSNEVTVTVILASSVSLIKTADPTLIEAGETVTYTFDVTNNGDTDLTNCNIVDDNLGPIGDLNFALVSGQSETFTTSTEIFVDTTNEATVLCSDPDGFPVGDTDTATVTVLVVGGEFLPIDTAALLVAGAQTNAAWILSALVGIGSVAFGALYLKTKRE